MSQSPRTTETLPRGLIARLAAVEPAPPWGWNAALSTIAVTLIAGLLIVPLFITAWLDVRSITFPLIYLIVGLVMAYWVTSTRTEPNERAALHMETPETPLLFLLFIMIGFALALDLLSLGVTGNFLPMMELATFDRANAGVIDWVLAVGLMVFVQPIAEGLVFFGVLFPLFRSRVGAWLGLALTGFSYGAAHFALYTAGGGSLDAKTLIWYGLVLPSLHGLILAGVRAHTRSTRAAIFAHAAFGLFAVLKLFAITG